MANGPTLTVQAPTRSPMLGGLLAVANVIDGGDVHAGNGVNSITNQGGLPQLAPGLCWPLVQPAVPTNPKTFDGGIDSLETDPFALYFGVKCGLLFSDDYSERASSQLAFNESYGVEQVFEETFLAAARAAAASVRSAVRALALLEGTAGIGQLTIHMNRAVATLLISRNLLTSDSEHRLMTLQGSLVANGSGYDNSPAANQSYMYATGQVNIWRSPIITTMAQNPAYNTAMAIAERIYSITIDGSAVAVIVDTTL